jgi:hypothetical protein
MMNWFECKVRYHKIDERTGKEKIVNEPYLVDAITFGEAEERIFKEMEAYISGEFTVTNIRKANITDIFPNEEQGGDRWYKAKVTFMSIDEAAGKEKKVANHMMVCADSVEKATEAIKKGLDGMTVDFEVVSVAESPVMDYFAYMFGNKDVGLKGAQLGAKRAEAQAKAAMIAEADEEAETDEPED